MGPTEAVGIPMPSTGGRCSDHPSGLMRNRSIYRASGCHRMAVRVDNTTPLAAVDTSLYPDASQTYLFAAGDHV